MPVSPCQQVKRIFCKHGLHNYSFLIETDEGEVAMCLCRDCYDRLKGSVLQSVINEAVRSTIPKPPKTLGVFR